MILARASVERWSMQWHVLLQAANLYVGVVRLFGPRHQR